MPYSDEEMELLFSRALQTRDRDEKKELCRTIVEAGTETPFGLFCLAWLVAEKPDGRARALALYEEALGLNPKFWFAHFERGNIFYDSGSFADAEREYEAAMADGVSAANLFFNAGLACEKNGGTDRALHYYGRAIETDPEHDGAYFARGSLGVSLRNFEGAVADFSQAIRIKPENFNYVLTRGLAYANMRRLEQALSDFNRALELKPGEPAVCLYRGNIHLLMGDYDGAVEDFSAVVRAEPGNAVAYEFLGILFCVQRQFQQGLWCFRKSLELNPGNTRILGMVSDTGLDRYQPVQPSFQ